jgi:hypothetical protein
MHAQQYRCVATPEAAAEATLSPRPSAQEKPGMGYRVQDVQIDPLTRRVWMRVRQCGNDSAPAVLVPIQAVAAQVFPLAMSVPTPIRAPLLTTPPPVIALHAGDNVRVVWMTESIRFNVEGKALQQAAEGDMIAVALSGTANEPGQRIHGTLRANHTVEMQP